MFQTKKSQPSTNTSNNSNTSTRIKTNMSLTELVESNFKNNNHSNKQNNFNKQNNSNKQNQFKNNNNNNMFYKKPKIIKEEFKVKMEEFPVLVIQSQSQTQSQTQPQTQKYSEKLQSVKVEQENYKMRISKKPKEYKKKDIQDTIISEYYNPSLNLRILNDRQEYREELNDILGDISPYWNNITQEELSELEDEELLISDNDDEYNYNIIEDW